jgi:hypothetical protein
MLPVSFSTLALFAAGKVRSNFVTGTIVSQLHLSHITRLMFPSRLVMRPDSTLVAHPRMTTTCTLVPWVQDKAIDDVNMLETITAHRKISFDFSK